MVTVESVISTVGRLWNCKRIMAIDNNISALLFYIVDKIRSMKHITAIAMLLASLGSSTISIAQGREGGFRDGGGKERDKPTKEEIEAAKPRPVIKDIPTVCSPDVAPFPIFRDELAAELKKEYAYYMNLPNQTNEQRLEQFKYASGKVLGYFGRNRAEAWKQTRCVRGISVSCPKGVKVTRRFSPDKGTIFLPETAVKQPPVFDNGDLSWINSQTAEWTTGCKKRPCATEFRVTFIYTEQEIEDRTDDEMARASEYIRSVLKLPI